MFKVLAFELLVVLTLASDASRIETESVRKKLACAMRTWNERDNVPVDAEGAVVRASQLVPRQESLVYPLFQVALMPWGASAAVRPPPLGAKSSLPWSRGQRTLSAWSRRMPEKDPTRRLGPRSCAASPDGAAEHLGNPAIRIC